MNTIVTQQAQTPSPKPNPQGEGGGHPEVITESVVLLLIEAFQNGLDVRSACVYA